MRAERGNGRRSELGHSAPRRDDPLPSSSPFKVNPQAVAWDRVGTLTPRGCRKRRGGGAAAAPARGGDRRHQHDAAVAPHTHRRRTHRRTHNHTRPRERRAHADCERDRAAMRGELAVEPAPPRGRAASERGVDATEWTPFARPRLVASRTSKRPRCTSAALVIQRSSDRLAGCRAGAHARVEDALRLAEPLPSRAHLTFGGCTAAQGPLATHARRRWGAPASTGVVRGRVAGGGIVCIAELASHGRETADPSPRPFEPVALARC